MTCRRRLGCLLAATVASACSQSRDIGTSAIPADARPLAVLSRIETTVGFRPSGATVTPDCRVLLVGGDAGTIVRLSALGEVDGLSGVVPGQRQRSRLEITRSGRAMLWTNAVPYFGVVNERLAADSILLPPAMGGERLAGPFVEMDSGLAILIAGDPATPIRSTPASDDAALPIAILYNPDSQEVTPVGTQRRHAGAFLQWLYGRAAIGAIGDTIIVLGLIEARVSGWAPPYLEPAWETTLAAAFEWPTPKEHVTKHPWVDEGGDVIDLEYMARLASGAILDDGTLVTVTNLGASWQPRLIGPRDRGQWFPSAQAIELHSPRGVLLKRFALPTAEPVKWLAKGSHGLVLLGYENQILIVNPLDLPRPCSGWPVRVQVRSLDQAGGDSAGAG